MTATPGFLYQPQPEAPVETDIRREMQEIFDKGLKGVRSQRRQSFGRTEDSSLQWGNRCLYRGPGGARCVVGWNIADEEYDPMFEEVKLKRLCQPYSAGSVRLPYRLAKHYEFLADLQHAHDAHAAREQFMFWFEYKMKKVAEKYGLEYAVE